MKSITPLVVAVASILMLTAPGKAEEPHYSPKGKVLADSLRKVPTVADGANLALEGPVGNAKTWQLVRSFRSVPSTGRDVDLAHGPRPTMSPKDPRYEVAVRANAEAKTPGQIEPSR